MELLPTPASTSQSRMRGLDFGPESAQRSQVIPILQLAMEKHASDVHLVAGLPPIFRIDGELTPTSDPAFNRENLKILIQSVLTQAQWEEFERTWQLCMSLYVPELGHFRVTVYYHAGNVEAAVRVCPLSLRTPHELGLPAAVGKLIERRTGLILITGPTGSGKTTTFNCLIDMLNRSRRSKIITVEDPVEYVHDNRLSIIIQQQIGSDAPSFSDALKHILRMDPDVVGVGEMRDLETISTAITAAETGHLVIATLHTPDATGTVDRIVDAFPGDRQQQILIQLASCLQGVIAQQLLPRLDSDGRVLATEVMVATPAVRNQIRERKMQQLRSTIETSRADDMHLMDHSLRDLYQSGIISYDTAMAHAYLPENIGHQRGSGDASSARARVRRVE